MSFFKKGNKMINLDNVQYVEIVQGFNILNFYFDGGKKYQVDFTDSADREAGIKEILGK